LDSNHHQGHENEPKVHGARIDCRTRLDPECWTKQIEDEASTVQVRTHANVVAAKLNSACGYESWLQSSMHVDLIHGCEAQCGHDFRSH
jgi:hypothetical protein